MADKISRRSFLKGTGKTILTAGALSSGIGLSTSSTPLKTVVPKVPYRYPPSPKARAYRSFLKGIRLISGKGSKNKYGKSIIKALVAPQVGSIAQRAGTVPTLSVALKEFEGRSIGRQAFESSISKGDHVGSSRIKGTSSIASKVVAQTIAPDLSHKPEYKGSRKKFRAWQVERLSKTIHATGRTVLAKKLQERRAIRKKLVKKGLIDKRKNTKIKGAKVGGGGKMALPGLESAKNPTGMSLLTRRSLLM